MSEPLEFPPGRAAALERLAAFAPERYARSRNFLRGTVSRLSPYVRHGILDLAEVRDAIVHRGRKPYEIAKFITELAWRDYFRRVYGVLGERIWDDVEPYKTGYGTGEYAADVPDDVRSGATGAACIDGFVRDLLEDGYVHNHARMYFASYVVHHRRVRWQAGAAFYLAHLLDGDPASNNLSWQWVASTFGDKPYFFNRDNLERYTEGEYCRRCPLAAGGCPFDGDYATLDARLFLRRRGPRTDGESLDIRAPADPPAIQAPPIERAVVWVHADALNERSAARTAFPAAPAIYADGPRAAGWPAKRRAFVDGALAEMRIDARGAGVEEIVAFARSRRAQAVVTVESPEPELRRMRAAIGAILPVYALEPPPFSRLDRATDLRRFSRYWRRASASALDIAAGDDGR